MTDVLVPPIDVPTGSLAFAFWALLALLAARIVRSTSTATQPPVAVPGEDVATRTVRAAATVVLSGSLVFAVLALLPPIGVWILVFVLVAAAIATGWTARELLVDIVAAGLLHTEGLLDRNVRLSHESVSGKIHHVGWRSVTLRTADNTLVRIPNRDLLKGAFEVHETPWPMVTIELFLPGEDGEHARSAIERALSTCAWLAPAPTPRIGTDSVDLDRWLVTVPLIEERFASHVRHSLALRVQHALAETKPPR